MRDVIIFVTIFTKADSIYDGRSAALRGDMIAEQTTMVMVIVKVPQEF